MRNVGGDGVGELVGEWKRKEMVAGVEVASLGHWPREGARVGCGWKEEEEEEEEEEEKV